MFKNLKNCCNGNQMQIYILNQFDLLKKSLKTLNFFVLFKPFFHPVIIDQDSWTSGFHIQSHLPCVDLRPRPFHLCSEGSLGLGLGLGMV